jgi:hypothetical protein
MLVSDDAKVDEDINPSSLGNELHRTHIHTKVSIPERRGVGEDMGQSRDEHVTMVEP